MRTAQLLLFFLLLCCQTTESLTDKRVNLGQNVTLDCQIDLKDVYWVFQKLTDSPVLILRTFSSDATSSFFYNERFKGKYSSLTLSRLFINNITIDELGIYYCAKTGTPLQLSNATKLYIPESAEDLNQTENHLQSQHDKTLKTYNILLAVTSFILNIVLIIVIIGLLIPKLKKPTKRRQHHEHVEAEQIEDFNAVQYSEIELPTYSREEIPKQINSTYVLLQKPKLHPRVQHNVNLHSC